MKADRAAMRKKLTRILKPFERIPSMLELAMSDNLPITLCAGCF
jgi:hypothetical protein